MTAGTMLLVWMGELIDEHGIGNGISMIIFGGIVARLPCYWSASSSRPAAGPAMSWALSSFW